MKIKSISNSNNSSFKSRNWEIRQADKILHKIKSEFPAASPFLADCYARKQKIARKIGAEFASKKLGVFRKIQQKYLNNDYEYSNALMHLIKISKVMNCKENSELAYLIALSNGFKDCNCVCLGIKFVKKAIKDLEHTILLINQKIPEHCMRLDKYYGELVSPQTIFKPERKSIVIDSTFGIADYWDNAKLQYRAIYPSIKNAEIFAAAREKIIKNKEDIEKLKENFPSLIIK